MPCISIPALAGGLEAGTLAATLPEVVTVTGALAGGTGLGALGTAALAGGALAAGAGAAGAFSGGGVSGGTPPGWGAGRGAPATPNTSQLYDPRYFAQQQGMDVPGGQMNPVSMEDAQAWAQNYGSGQAAEQVGVTAPGVTGGTASGMPSPIDLANPLISGAAAAASANVLSPNLTGFTPNADGSAPGFFDKYGMPLATIGSSLLSAGGGLLAANTAADAQKQSLALQKQAQDNAMQIFQTGQKNLQPFMSGGAADFDRYNEMLGLGGNTTGTNPLANGPSVDDRLALLENTPGYKFQRDQGLLGVQNLWASKGLGGTGPQVGPGGTMTGGNGPSGALLRGGIEFNQGLAGTYYDNYIKSLMAGAGLGENAAAGFGNNAVGAGGNLVQFGANQGTTAANIGAVNAGGLYNAFNQAGVGLTSGAYGFTNPLVNNPAYMYPYNPNAA